MEHHPFGGSSIGLRSKCPGSYQMSRALEPPGSDDMAARGTILHRLMVPGEAAVPSDALSEHELVLLHRARGWLSEMLERHMPAEVYFEQRFGPLALDYLDIPEEHWPWTTPDFVLIQSGNGAGSLAFVGDYKFGPLELDDELISGQALMAAAILFQRCPWLARVEVGIAHLESDTVFEKSIDSEAARKAAYRMADVIREAIGPSPSLRPSRTACARCWGAYRCPTAYRELDRFELKSFVEFEKMGAVELGATYDFIQMVEEHAGRMRARIRDLVDAGQEIAGYRKIETTTRSISNVLGAYYASKLPLEEFLDACSLSITKLENVWCEAAMAREKMSKKAALVHFDDALRKLIERRTGFQLRKYTERKVIDGPSGG